MKLRTLSLVVAFAFASALLARPVFAQAKDEKKPAAEKKDDKASKKEEKKEEKAAQKEEKKDEKKPGDKPAAAQPPADKPAAAGGAPPSMDEAMKRMMELGTPGKEHEGLKALEGTWDCTINFYAAPGAPPQASKGVMTRKWALGGRYLIEEFKGESMGMPFEGMGIVGYDKGQKMYFTLWMDSWSTGYMTQTGQMEGKVLTVAGENFDPMEGKKVKGKTALDMADAGKHVMKMFGPGPDGKEFMMFEMISTKK